jgi:hypothetical protein
MHMNDQNKILYEHLKDYPTSTDSYHGIGNRAVAAALCCEHMPEIAEASPEKSLGFGKKSRTAIAVTTVDPTSIRRWRSA